MRYRLFLFTIFLYFSAGAESVLSFRDALVLTEAYSAKIKSSEFEVLAAKRNLQAAKGLYFPQVNLRGAYIHAQKDLSVDFNPLKDILGQSFTSPLFGLDWRYTIQKRSFGFIGSDITIPIFTGGKIIAANRAAKIAYNAALSQSKEAQCVTITELVKRYFGYILASNVVKVREKVVQGFREHLSDMEHLLENGMVAEAELLYAKYTLAQAESDLKSAILQCSTTLESLRSTTGLNTTITTTTPIFIVTAIGDLSSFQRCAAESNPQLEYIEQQKLLAKQNIALNRAELLPQIAFMGGGGFTHRVTDILPRWAIGVGVNFKIFDGLNKEYRYSSAKSSYKRVEQLEIEAQRDISLLIHSLYNSTISHLTKAQSLSSAVAFSKEYLRVKKIAFSEGATTSTEVIEATINFAKSQIERLEAAYNFDVALAELLQASGSSNSFIDYCENQNKIVVEYEVY